MRKLYVSILAAWTILCLSLQTWAQVPEVSVGPVPSQFIPKGYSETILPTAPANPASRSFVYSGSGPFQLSKHGLANTSLTNIGGTVTFGFPGAAAWVTTTNLLYVVDQQAPFALYTVDTLTGARTFVANCTGVPHSNLTGMTWDISTSTMYGMSTSLSASALFTINLSTGVCTPIGSSQTTAPGVIMVNAAPGGSLFAVDIVNDQLYRINKTTGAATSVGPLGFNANFGQDGHFDLSDGQYYFAAFNATAFQPQLRIIDTLNGSSTLVAPYSVVQVQTMGIYTPLAPDNDDCANARTIACGQTSTGTTAQANIDGPPTSCTGGSVAKDVWFKIVGNGVVNTASLCGSSYDTKIDIYTGSCGALTCVASNDDFCGAQSQVQWLTTAGLTYYIRVHGFAGATGNYTLSIICPAPNDDCSNATNINCGQSINGTTVGSTNETAPSCVGSMNPGVWYTFIGSGGPETISLCSAASFDTKLSVYTGTCASLTCVAANDDFCGVRSEVSLATVAGTRYYVLVNGFAGATGTFTITRTCAPCAGVPSPGAITGSATPVCPGTTVTMNLAGNTIANGITYQWRSSTTPGGPYTAIPGANSVSYTFTANTTTYFIVSVTCTNPGGGTGNTVEFPVNVSNLVHSNVLATPTSSCSPGVTVITGTVSGTATLAGNYTHTLTGPGAINAPVASGTRGANFSFTVTAIPPGVHTYQITSTDPIGCTVVTNVTVTVNLTPDITLTTTPAGVPPAPAGTNYQYTVSYGNAIVPGTTLVAGSQGDDVTASISFPFPVNVYGTNYTSALVSSNGNLQFSGGGNASFSNQCLPSANNLGAPFLMPHWDDLQTNLNAGDGVYTSVSGVAPNRIFNIEWRATLFGSATSVTNFQIRLYEGQQRFDYIYGSIRNNASGATIGVQGAAAPTTLFTSYSCNSVSVGSGLQLSFTLPAPVTICNGAIVRMDAQANPTVAQTFNGPNNTHIPSGGNTDGPASPYPNAINVSVPATSGVTVRSVTLNLFSHQNPDDVDIVLVSPTGQSVILMSDAGGSTAASNLTYTFSDAALNNLADNSANPSGNYKPTNYGAGDVWPAPGPGGAPVSTSLSSFTGNPNGNWSLYIVDDASGNTGFLSSWSLVLDVPQPVVFSPTTNLFTDAAATVAYTGTPAYTVWARPNATTTYTASYSANGCSNSRSVGIIVNNAPAITVQPAALSAPVCPGFNVTYSVTATGTTLTYQWQVSTNGGVSWSNIADGLLYTGTATNTLVILNVQTSQNNTQYRCIVSGVCPPAVTSNAVTLVVSTPPTITTQPANRTVCSPGDAVFTVVAAGVPTPNIYQWQVSTDAGVTWTNLTTGGSYTPTLTISPTAASQSGNRYRVIVTNSCGQSITSSAVILTVNVPTPVTIATLPSRICLTDTLINLQASPVGGVWSGLGISGTNFVPSTTTVGQFPLTYSYVNAVGCPSSATVIASVVDCPERVRQLDRDKAVILFPNPNNGRFNIRINSVLYNFLGMRVYTVDGRLVTARSFNGLVYGRVVPINLSNLPSGTYMVKFFYDDGIRTSEKTFPVIIQR